MVIGRTKLGVGREEGWHHEERGGSPAKNSSFAIVWGSVWLAICDKRKSFLTVYDV